MKTEKKTKVYERPSAVCVALEREYCIAGSKVDSSQFDDFDESDYNFGL